MSNVIPIFPLNLVVFPKSKYPLHIFEERYKRMISKCIAEKRGFGIVAMVDDKLANIGSYVIISGVTKKYENGEMDIIVTGVGRFIIQDVMVHANGYSLAEISEYNDKPVDINENLLAELQSVFENIVAKINFQLEESFWNNYSNASAKSFKIAEKAGLSLRQQQELLTIQNENARLSFLLEHFDNLDKKLSESSALRNIIMGDGFIQG